MKRLIQLLLACLPKLNSKPPTLRDTCKHLAKELHLKDPRVDNATFLYAVTGVESSFGKNLGHRFEPAYAPGGHYFSNARLQAAYSRYGKDASSSFGPWQILYISAAELGFSGAPLELQNADICGPFVVNKFNRIIASGADTVEKVLDAWNTGSWKKGEVPVEYINQFWNYYTKIRGGSIA